MSVDLNIDSNIHLKRTDLMGQLIRSVLTRFGLIAPLVFLSLFLSGTIAMAQPIMRHADFSILSQTNLPYQFHTLNFDSLDKERHYRVYVGIPKKPAPSQGFPSFYALDGNALLESLNAQNLTELNQRNAPPVLVLIGYATDERFDVVARAYDYTPRPIHGETSPDMMDPSRQNGGADLLLDLIANQIRPAVSQLTRINPNEQTLWGHSYGGLFSLYALLTRPQLFQTYVSADPSIWTQNGAILQYSEQFKQNSGTLAPTHLWLMKSGQERPERQLDERQAAALKARTQTMQKLGENLAEQLGNDLSKHVANLSVRYDVSPNDNHGSFVVNSFLKALLEPAVMPKVKDR